MAKRFSVQALSKPSTDADLKSYEDQIKAKGWSPIAQVRDETGDTQIIFEVADDATNVAPGVIPSAAVIGVPDTYPREQDPVAKRY